jgi:hypothetical protein
MCSLDVRQIIGKNLADLTSDDDKTRQSAKMSLLEHSISEAGIAALREKTCYKALQGLGQGKERQVAFICMSRIACHMVTGKVDWEEGSLTEWQGKFTTVSIDTKEELLKAVRLFVLAYQDKVALVVGSGWLDTAFTCSQDSYEGAVLLLDALHSHESLPELVVRAGKTATMLSHIINKGREPTRLAALRVASRVALSLGQGTSGAAPSEAAEWLTKLHNAHIVKALLGCLNGGFSEAVVDSAAGMLTQLGKHQQLVKEVGTKGVLRSVMAKVSSKKPCPETLFVLLAQILTLEDVAIAFVSMDGPATCLAGLVKADHGAAKGILGALLACSDRIPDPLFRANLDWRQLVKFLTAEDRDLIRLACVLLSLALSLQTKDRSAALVKRLIQQDAVTPLLSILSRPEANARNAVQAFQCLLVYGREQQLVNDRDSAAVFVRSGCISRVLMELNNGCSRRTFAAAAYCLEFAVRFAEGVADDLVLKDVVGKLVARVGREMQNYRQDALIEMTLSAVRLILEKADDDVISGFIRDAAGSTAVKILFQVSTLLGTHISNHYAFQSTDCVGARPLLHCQPNAFRFHLMPLLFKCNT